MRICNTFSGVAAGRSATLTIKAANLALSGENQRLDISASERLPDRGSVDLSVLVVQHITKRTYLLPRNARISTNDFRIKE